MLQSVYFAALVLAISISVVFATQGFTLENFYKGEYADKKWSGVWYDETHILERQGDDPKQMKFVLRDVTTNKVAEFLSHEQLKDYDRPSLTISPSKDYVLVKHSATKVYRHSTLAKYVVLNKQNNYKPVELPADIKDTNLRICRFTSDDSLIIVNEDNNIRLITDLNGTPILTDVTTDDTKGYIFNGVPDWIYEEEVISGDSALWTSPFSPLFAYVKFNDEHVREFTYFKYGTPGKYADVYPKHMTVRYPKSGATNPTFSVHVYDKTTKTTSNLDLVLDVSKKTEDYVLYDLAWRSEKVLLVLYTNREQDEAYLDECILNSPATCQRLKVTKEMKGWLVIQPLYVLKDKRVIQVIPKDNFDAFNVITSETDQKEVSLGEFTVSRIIGHKDSTIYFEGTEAEKHSQVQVYSIDITPGKASKVCLSCDEKVYGLSCLRASAVFNKEMSYVTRICSGPGPTYVDVKDFFKDAKSVPLEENTELRTRLNQKSMPTFEDLFVAIPGTEVKAAVRLVLPPGFDKSKKYAMLVNVYAGPNSNQISDAYSIGVQHYLTTYKEYIYAYIDSSGSGKRGYKLMHRIYKGLGTHEIDDQITVTKELIKTNSYIDENRVGIWGWSYGGFSTAHAIARDEEATFKCGVSVAPVTDFIYYDSIYTERYMGVYDDNNEDVKKAYAKTDVTQQAGKFKNKNFMLVHGNADDNVHYQQGMQLARALELKDIPFEQMSYPDEAHDLAGVKPHLYHMLDSYWTQHLGIGATNSGNTIQSRDLWNPRPFGKFKKLIHME